MMFVEIYQAMSIRQHFSFLKLPMYKLDKRIKYFFYQLDCTKLISFCPLDPLTFCLFVS